MRTDAGPIAFLVARNPTGDARCNVFPLSDERYVIGRGENADLAVVAWSGSVSRQHAAFDLEGARYSVEDLGSSTGTRRNGLAIEPGKRVALAHGDEISLGDLAFLILYMRPLAETVAADLRSDVLALLREMSSLDVSRVVSRALELVKLISGYSSCQLVSTQERWRWPTAEGALAFTDLASVVESPDLKVSRNLISKVLETGEKLVSTFSEADVDLSVSVIDLEIKRAWIAPVYSTGQRPVAVLYLHSTGDGPTLNPEQDSLLDAIAQQIGLLIRNAWLFDELKALSRSLELRVEERTRELKASQERLISQDRLVTLGRLVAGIAHELNNPSGAIASLANTQAKDLPAVVRLQRDLLDRCGDDAGASATLSLLDAIVACAAHLAPDSRRRRDREARLAEVFRASDVGHGDWYARVLAKTAVPVDIVAAHVDAFMQNGDELIASVERLHTFAKATRTIGTAARNIARIVGGLKQYAHLDQAELVTGDLHEGLQAMLDVLAARIPDSVKVVTHFGDLPPVPHRPGEMTQVWTNLVDNALQAMGETGTLTLETACEADQVVVRVADTGPGIPVELRDSLYELHATTRGPGAGLGLGLPICRAIVENHGGRIEHESEPGRTIFMVRLPLTQTP